MANTNIKKVRRKRISTPLSSEQQREAELVAADNLRDNPEVFDLPESKVSVEDLTDYLSKSKDGSQRILPKERRRYAMYLRKSTDSEDRQVRSLDDQRVECLMLAENLGITIREEDIFVESASAKISGKRPIFDKMLDGFEKQRYHGLLAWSPDRLSRNMKEAGEIIEMIDQEKIQDLHFKTYQFDNTPNGKMLLGILFATSKQYSDKLSVDVSRGIKGIISEGKYVGLSKRGYYADVLTNYFLPDAHNWQLLRRAVLMRLEEGKTNQEVADFLNNSHFSYRSRPDDTYKLAKMDKKSIGLIFKDPFYCGIYKYGNYIANIIEMYGFLPLVTPDEFIALGRNIANNFNAEFKGRSSSPKKLDFGLLREKVICDYCGKTMQFQRTEIPRGKNIGKYMISYYCRNKDCIRHNNTEAIKKYGHKLHRSIRLKYVTTHIVWTIQHCTKNTLEAYKLYIGRLEQKLAVDREIAKRKLADAKSELKQQEISYVKHQNLQVESLETYNRHHKGKLEQIQETIQLLKANINAAEKELEQLKNALPTHEQFVELLQSYLKTILTTTDLMEEDLVYEQVVLNLRAGDDIVTQINLNPPYDLMVDLDKISTGRGERI